MWALARDQYPRRHHLGGLESPYRENSSGDPTRFNPRMHPAVARKSEETAETIPQRSEKPHDEHDAGCFRRSREKARRRRSRPRSDQKRTGPPLRTALKIGLTGFEPATSTPPVWRATKLRYSPRSSCLPN
jgi:hypothetical protein